MGLAAARCVVGKNGLLCRLDRALLRVRALSPIKVDFSRKEVQKSIPYNDDGGRGGAMCDDPATEAMPMNNSTREM
jgi:hypothetical protein